MSTWILTPCEASRIDELKDMLYLLEESPERVVIITTLPNPIDPKDMKYYSDHVILFDKTGMLFGEWLNLGLDYIAEHCKPDDYVMHVGSSIKPSRNTATILEGILEEHKLLMAGPNLHGNNKTIINIDVQQRTLENRVPAMTFMVKADSDIRFDPQFRWWYTDDDFEAQHLLQGKTGITPAEVEFTSNHYMSEEQQQWAIEDRIKYVSKHGCEPW